jgi:hypothetical protein
MPRRIYGPAGGNDVCPLRTVVAFDINARPARDTTGEVEPATPEERIGLAILAYACDNST